MDADKAGTPATDAAVAALEKVVKGCPHPVEIREFLLALVPALEELYDTVKNAKETASTKAETIPPPPRVPADADPSMGLLSHTDPVYTNATSYTDPVVTDDSVTSAADVDPTAET